jgi:Carboxypeptidase regulatory-like domain
MMPMRVLRALIVLAISLVSVDVIAAGHGQAESASLSGTASDAAGRALSNTGVQLRNVSTGQLAGSTMTNTLGQYSFPNLPAGTYLAEVINAAGQIVATSAAVDVTSGWAITDVSVVAPAAAGAGHSQILGMSPRAAIITGAAAAAGVTGIAMAARTASPSQ